MRRAHKPRIKLNADGRWYAYGHRYSGARIALVCAIAFCNRLNGGRRARR